MTSTSKKMLIVSILLVLALGGGFVILTGFGPGASHGWRGGFHGRGMPACIQKEIGSFILWRMDKQAGELGLSGSQQELYTSFRNQMEQTLSKAVDARMEIRGQARSQFEQEVLDLSVVARTVKKELDTMSMEMGQGLALFSKFYDTLDDAQKKQLSDHIRERAACRREGWKTGVGQG